LAERFDAETYARELTAIVRPLSDTGATVLMGTFPDDLPVLRLARRKVARKFRTRLHEASEVVRTIAADHNAVCVDSPGGWRYGMADCSLDGCHPNARGHALIAELALAALCERGGLPAARIARDGCGWLATSVGHLRWLASEGYLRRPPIPEVLRGSGD
jgi:lysophospholipase L1-like esterase